MHANQQIKRFLRLARRIHAKVAPSDPVKSLPIFCEGQAASDLIRTLLSSDNPCMICRFGNAELDEPLPAWMFLPPLMAYGK